MIFRVLIISLNVFITSGFVTAQDDWNATIGKTNGLVIQQEQHVEISIDDNGKLEIISMIYEETQHFGENANLFSAAKRQFYFNMNDNSSLDPNSRSWGYTVFGEVITGMEVLEAIAEVETGYSEDLDAEDVPVETVMLISATVVE